jgi:hypothetical protein
MFKSGNGMQTTIQRLSAKGKILMMRERVPSLPESDMAVLASWMRNIVANGDSSSDAGDEDGSE